MYTLTEIQNHGKSKWQICDFNSKHIAYLNNKHEAQLIVNLLNEKRYV